MMEYFQNLLNQAGELGALYIALIAIGSDTLSGYIKHLWLGDICSKEFRKGLYNKLEWAPLLIVMYAIYFISGNSALAYSAALVITVSEVTSIMENMIQMGKIKNELVVKYFKVEPIDREEYRKNLQDNKE